jgi:hypothetical protein
VCEESEREGRQEETGKGTDGKGRDRDTGKPEGEKGRGYRIREKSWGDTCVKGIGKNPGKAGRIREREKNLGKLRRKGYKEKSWGEKRERGWGFRGKGWGYGKGEKSGEVYA